MSAGTDAQSALIKGRMIMILRQYLHTEPVASSYLFGCAGKSSGAVVDPLGAIEPYIEAAAATGMRIVYVIGTHVHADHISGTIRSSGKSWIRNWAWNQTR